MVVQSSRDQLVRYLGVDSDPVNWSWLCDRGRFNFEATESDDRLSAPLVRGEGGLAPVSWSVAMSAAAHLVRDAIASGGPGSIAVLGGARGTNEDAFAWARLAEALDIRNRDAHLADGLPVELLALPARDDRRRDAGEHRDPPRPRPQGGAARPPPAPPSRGRATQGQVAGARPAGHGSQPARLAQRADRGRWRRRHPHRAQRPRGRRPARRRPRRRRRRPGQPRRVRRRSRRRATRRPRRRAPRPRSCRHCAAATWSAPCSSG